MAPLVSQHQGWPGEAFAGQESRLNTQEGTLVQKL